MLSAKWQFIQHLFGEFPGHSLFVLLYSVLVGSSLSLSRLKGLPLEFCSRFAQ